MFKPPIDVNTTVFARLPDEFRTAGPDNEWVRGQPGGSPTKCLLEGPSFDRDGNLWCVDLPNGRIFRVGQSGSFHMAAEYDGWPNGLKVHKDGRIFIADYKNGIMEMDPVSGKVRPYLERVNLERFKAVNDLFFGARGELYFTDQGLTGLHDPAGRVFRVMPDGRVDCLLDNVPSPNGLVLNLDKSMLYVAVTRGNCVWRVPLMPDGGVAKVGLFVQLSGAGAARTVWRWTRRGGWRLPMWAWVRCGSSIGSANRCSVCGLALICTRPTWPLAARTGGAFTSRNLVVGPSLSRL